MLSPKDVATALLILQRNAGVNQLCYEMDWRDLSPLAEAVKLKMVSEELGRHEDLIYAYSIQARTEISQFPHRDDSAKFHQRDRQINGLVNLCSKCTNDFIIYYAFPTTQVVTRPASQF